MKLLYDVGSVTEQGAEQGASVSVSRRDFLKILAAVSATGISGTFASSASTFAAELKNTAAAKRGSYTVRPWCGDNFALGHRLRDGELPQAPQKAERTVDFVIVGGGMAGLCTAHHLKDQDFLLLEQYEQTGGTSSGGSYRGIDYSRGAVCTGSDGALKQQLFDELNIKPVVITAEETEWHSAGQWYKSLTGNDKFHKEFNRLLSEIKAIKSKSDTNLGEVTFAGFLSGYDRELVGLINNISRSFFCAGPDYVSATAGFFMLQALTSDSYVFDGGNSGIARALRGSVDTAATGRIHTDCFVWSVKPTDKGAAVVYGDSSGNMHRVDCKHVVVTTPPLVAVRILPELPEKVKAAWSNLEYGAFVVANFCMPKKVLQCPYQSFADDAYPFSQMVLAEAPYQAAGKYKPDMGSVLTVYHPFLHGSVGRRQLLNLEREQFASSLVAQVTSLFEPLQNNLDQIEITRWGHAVMVPRPGLSSILNKANQYTTPWMTFAHSSAGGGQSLEGALSAARNAADTCLKIATT